MMTRNPRKYLVVWGTRIIKNDDSDASKWLGDIHKALIELGPSIEMVNFLDDHTCKIWYADPKYV